MELNSTFKDRLNEALSDSTLTQVELANLVGVSKSLLNKYIKGLAKPKNNTLNKIALALHVNPVRLMGFNVQMKDTLNERKKIASFIEDMSEEDFTKLKVFLVNFFNYKD